MLNVFLKPRQRPTLQNYTQQTDSSTSNVIFCRVSPVKMRWRQSGEEMHNQIFAKKCFLGHKLNLKEGLFPFQKHYFCSVLR